jgi:uncharacterized tellurite resistance protein B-like protein
MIFQNFYQELGKLLFAVAKADGTISKKELKALHESVLSDILPLEDSTDEFGTDAAFYVEMQFETLEVNNANPDECFQSFVDYVKEHHTAFNEELKQLVIKVSEKIANSYYGTNSKEQKLLNELREKLKSI